MGLVYRDDGRASGEMSGDGIIGRRAGLSFADYHCLGGSGASRSRRRL
jgi:hypothetical protein